MPAEATFGQYRIEFLADAKGLKADLDRLRTYLTQTAPEIEKTLGKGFTTGMARARESISSLAETAGEQFGKIAVFATSPLGAIAALGAGVTAFAVSAVKDAAEFDAAFKRVRLVLAGTGSDIEALKAKIRDLTPSMASAAEEIAAVASGLAVGFSEEQSLRLADTAAKLARVTGTDLPTATRLLTDTLQAYGLTVEDVTRVSNVLLGVMRQAASPDIMGELQAGLGRILPLAAELHIPFEQVAAALLAMQHQGINVARGAQALGMILASVTAQAQKFRDANIDIAEVAATQGIPGVLDAIRKVSGGTIEDMRALGIQSRTLSAVLALSGEKVGLFRENLAGLAEVKLDEAMKSTEGLADATIDLHDAWKDFKTAVGTWAIPALAALTRTSAEVIKTVTGQRTKAATGTEGPEFEPWMVFGTESPEGQAWLARQGEAKAATEAVTEAIAKQGQVATETAAKIAEVEQVLPAAQRARMREDIENASRATADRIKLAEEATVKQIQMDKQIAEARRATGLELLAYDRKILETQLDFAARRRESRLQAIEAELPLLQWANAEERKLLLTLREERSRLQQEGLNDQQNYQRQLTLLAEKETRARIELDDAEFKARVARGQASLEDELAHLRRRADLARAGSLERVQMESEVYKKAQDIADRLFAHEQTLGLKSLRDEIERQRQKAEAAVAGSEARMKAEEDVFRKEEELRNKRRAGALGIIGEAAKRLEEKGISGPISITDLQREIQELSREEARKAAEAGAFAGGKWMTIEELKGGLEAAGRIEARAKILKEGGGLAELIGGGAAVQGIAPDILGELGLTGGFGARSFLAGFAPEDQSRLTESIAQPILEGASAGFSGFEAQARAAVDRAIEEFKRLGPGVRRAIRGEGWDWSGWARDLVDESRRM